MRSHARTLIITLVPVLALLAAACSADDSTPTPSPTPAPYPAWVGELIAQFMSEPVASPPLSITEYVYQGNNVYFVPQRCCDIFSDLYDAAGNLIAHPDGGIAGTGDGRASDFFSTSTLFQTIWVDTRVGDGRMEVLAPTVSVEVAILESSPQQYRVEVVSALPNGCHRFERSVVASDSIGRTFTFSIINSVPTDPNVACTKEYSTLNHSFPLQGDIVRGVTYTVVVNDRTKTFVGQ